MPRKKISYLEWLLNRVGIIAFCPSDSSRFEGLMMALSCTPYYFDGSIKFEENTVVNAMDSRVYFYESVLHKECPTQTVSLLEVMVETAVRYANFSGMENPGYYFIVMLEESGLIKFDDLHYDSDAVHEIIMTANRRLYGTDGVGGFFPITLGVSTYNAARTDFWKQMCTYWCMKEGST